MTLSAYGLSCEYRTEPLGIEEGSPRFGWKLRADERGQRQTAYRVTVRRAGAPGAGDHRWDSGWVGTDRTGAVYAGPPLEGTSRYAWRLELRDSAGRPTAPAESWFETGLPDWTARWIHADPHRVAPAQPPTVTDRSSRTARLSPPVLFRRAFTLPALPGRARAYVSARGVYRLTVNGRRAGDHELAPGWTEYHRRVQYQTYDLTGLLRAGANVLAATVADGWWSGYVGGDPRKHAYHYGVRPEFVVEVVMDGRRVVSDAAWRYSTGAVQYADLLMGEYHDARLAPEGWDRPGFDDADWHPVAVGEAPVNLVAQPDEPVRVTMTLPAVSVGDGVVDFGQNISGRVRLTVRGAPAGRRVRIRHGEALGPDGALYTDNLRTAEATDVYVTGGAPVEVFEPEFTVHGFRYAEVTGHPVAAADVVARVLHSDTPWTGEFACSDAQVHRLAANIAWSQRGNTVALPTDCPQRDERQGWTADAQVFLPTACRNADVAAFFARWMRDVRDGQSEDGAFPDIAPMVGVRPEGAPGWGDAGVIVPWLLWREYGDRRSLELSFEGMVAWLAHVERHNPGLIWRERAGRNYGDWLHLGADTPRDLVATAYFAHSARLVALTAGVLGRDAAPHAELAERVAAAFAAEFVGPGGTVAGDTQTGYLLALAFGLVPPDRVGPAFARLAAAVEKDGITAGFLGLPLLCPLLAEHGRADLAYALLHEDRYPSWGYAIRHGATTIWERWDGWTEDGGFQAAQMNSFNHYALGAVGDWLFGGVAGIGHTSEAYRDIVVAPVPGGRLTWARARQDTARGLVSSHWRLADGRLVLEVEIPPGPDATLVLPTDDPGSLRVDAGDDHVRSVEPRGDAVRVVVAPGAYTLSVSTPHREADQ